MTDNNSEKFNIGREIGELKGMVVEGFRSVNVRIDELKDITINQEDKIQNNKNAINEITTEKKGRWSLVKDIGILVSIGVSGFTLIRLLRFLSNFVR